MGLENPLINEDFLLNSISSILTDAAYLGLLINIKGETLREKDPESFAFAQGEIKKILADASDSRATKSKKYNQLLNFVTAYPALCFRSETVALINVAPEFALNMALLIPSLPAVFPNLVAVNEKQNGIITSSIARKAIRKRTGTDRVHYTLTSNAINRLALDAIITAANITREGGTVIHVVNRDDGAHLIGLDNEGFDTLVEVAKHMEQEVIVRNDRYFVLRQNSATAMSLEDIEEMLSFNVENLLKVPSAGSA
ncbi:MAG: hypothetical protein GC136_05480 [Alphaproteobacteria bacterium]|nr:hypothetical protein [Alphaproteobacteria bacterium]